MGDLPLRTPTDRRLGGPLPRLLPNRTHPHPSPINLYSIKDVLNRDHRALIFLSKGYSRAMGRLDTCYAPVRRSPSICASTNHAAPRLACVKPVASVHPEPGSNSSSLSIFVAAIKQHNLSVAKSRNLYFFSLSFRILTVSLFFLYYKFCLCKSFKERAPERSAL